MKQLPLQDEARRGRAGQIEACFCESCRRLLYLAHEDELFCPVCSWPVTPVRTATPHSAEEDAPNLSG